MDKLISGKLSDDTLEKITGGSEINDDGSKKNWEEEDYLYKVERNCPHCKNRTTIYVFSGGRGYCGSCDGRVNP